MVGSCFLKLFLIIVFENIYNTKIIFFEFTPCYLNLMFYMFFVFFKTKKKRTKSYYLYSPCSLYLKYIYI